MNDLDRTETSLPREPYTGEANKIRDLTNSQQERFLLLFSQVKNKVVAVNPNINAPLQITQGQETPLGVFAAATIFEEPEYPSSRHLEVLPENGRSALIGRVVFDDKDGHLYRDIDLKGIGYLWRPDFMPDNRATVSKPGHLSSLNTRYGLLDLKEAMLDYQTAEQFSSWGVRVAKGLAVVQLDEIVVEGKKISNAEALEQGIFDKEFTPAVLIRAFGTRVRVKDIMGDRAWSLDKDARKILLEDAKKLISQETGKELSSDEEYLNWMAETLGKNIATIHKNGKLHNGLHAQNITLDCRVVDFDDVSEITSKEKYEQELFIANRTLTVLLEATVGEYVRNNDPRLPALIDKFQNSYNSVFTPKDVAKTLKKLPLRTYG